MRKHLRMTERTKAAHRAPKAEAKTTPKPSNKRVPTNLSLPADLVAELDEIAGPRNRSAFAEAAIRKALKRERFRIAGEQHFGSLNLDDYPHWRTSEDVVEWVRMMRAEVTDSGDDIP
jgi:predicted transcriptional regulator